MTTRAVLGLLAVGVWLLAVLPGAASFAQSTEPAVDKYGWWNANQTLPADPTGGLLPALEVPPPPGAPEDGLYVEAAADGSPRAIAAATFFTGGGVDASLTLALAEGSSAEGVTVAACPAGGGWDAAQNGRWDRRPTYDAATCRFLGTPGTGMITFTVPAAAHEPGSSYLSLAIVPAAGSGAFAAGFAPPTSMSLITTRAAEAAPSSATPGPSPALGPVTFGGTEYMAPSAPTATAPTSSSPPTTTTGDETAAPELPSVPASADADQGSARVVAGLALALVGVAMWALTTRHGRAPRLLGSLASGLAPVAAAPVEAPSAPRGLGRFARGRTTPPDPI